MAGESVAMKVEGEVLAHAIAWTAAAKWSSQLVSWAALMVVARLLSPADFGLVGMTAVFTGLIATLAESGMGTAVITLRELDERQVQQINGAAVLFSIMAALVSWAMAWPVAGFYGKPEVAAILAVSAVGFVLTGFGSIPGALLERDLKFRTLAGIEAVQALVQSLTTMGLALSGAGYWALVAGRVAGGVVAAALYCLRRPCRLRWPSRAVTNALKLGGTVLAGRVAGYSYSSSDFLVAGRVFGAAALGYYSLAWNFANLPTEKVSAMVLSVTGSFFSALQHDRGELKRYLLLLTGALALLLFPIAAGMGVTAPEIIEVVFGARWLPATVPLQLLAIYGVTRSILTLLPPVLNVTGSAAVNTWTNIVCLAVLPASFWLAAQRSIDAVALVWVVVYPICALPLYQWAAGNLRMSFGEYFREVWPALNGCLVMTAGVYGLRQIVPPCWPAALRLACFVPAGILFYAATLLLFHRTLMLGHMEKLRRLRSRS